MEDGIHTLAYGHWRILGGKEDMGKKCHYIPKEILEEYDKDKLAKIKSKHKNGEIELPVGI